MCGGNILYSYDWIYVDLLKNIWKFTLKDNKDLVYRVMYDEDKWTNETLIIKNVEKYSLYVEDEAIHIVYIDIKNKLKYCTLKNKSWLGKEIYDIEDKYEIRQLVTMIFKGKMHIFYVLEVKQDNDHGVLVDCIWNGNEININTIDDIIIPCSAKEYFKVQVYNDRLQILFITDEGDGIALKEIQFEDKKWTHPRWLYVVQGNMVSFEALETIHGTNIINSSVEENRYLLEHVHINLNGNMKAYTIRKGGNEIKGEIIFRINSSIYLSWIENMRICYSSLKNETWSEIKYLDSPGASKFKFYNYIILRENNVSIQTKVYCIEDQGFKIIDSNTFLESEELKQGDLKQDNIEIDANNKIIELVQANRELEKEIDLLNIQMKKKERKLNEYESDYNTRINEDRANIFLEIQKSIQKEINRVKEQLKEERTLSSKLQERLNEVEKNNNALNQKIVFLNDENETLKLQLDEEKNKPIIKRILRGRSSDN